MQYPVKYWIQELKDGSWKAFLDRDKAVHAYGDTEEEAEDKLSELIRQRRATA